MTDIIPLAHRRAAARAVPRPLLLFALLTVLLALFSPVRATAQDGRARVFLSSGLVVEPGIETPLAIEIEPGRAVPGQSFVRIRGLPPSALLSDGHAITPGNWAVPLGSIKDLKVTAPVVAAGRSDIVVSLITIDGDVLAESRAQLTVAPMWLLRQQQATAADALVVETPKAAAEVPKSQDPAPKAAEAAPKAAEVPVAAAKPERQAALQPPPPVPAARPQPAPAPKADTPKADLTKPELAKPSPPTAAAPPVPIPPAAEAPVPPAVPSALERSISDNARRFLARGNEQLAQGNVREARLFLQRSAELGSAEAALTMAATYDEVEIKRMRLYGPRPDVDEARRWYERAKEMGASEAARFIARLDNVH